jgi:hypothetical protein
VIGSVYKWLGKHPKACLAPVALLALLTGAQLLAYSYGEVFMPETFFVAAGLWLVLGAVSALGVARTFWLRDQNRADLRAMEVRLSTGRWNGPTTQTASVLALVPRTATYGPAIVGSKDMAPKGVLRQLEEFDPEADTGPLGLGSAS